MVMTLRLNSSRRSGSCQIHHRRKKRAKFAAMSSPCWSFFFQHIRHCPQGIRTPWSNRQWQVLLWVFEAAVEGIRRKRPDKWKNNNWFLHHDKAPTHTSLAVQQFLNSKNITAIPHTLICLTSPSAPFSYFPSWNYGWKGDILTKLRRSIQNRKRLSTHSHLGTSSDAWNHGKHAGIAVYMPKGTTSKETVETRNYRKKFFMVKFPEFFSSTLYNVNSEFSDIGLCSNIVMNFFTCCIYAGPFENWTLR